MKSDSLVKICQAGNKEGYNRLYLNYSKAVYRWALFFGIDPAGAEEVTQDVFITAFRKISQLKSDNKLSAWLFQITRRIASNYRKSAWLRRVVRFEIKEGNKKVQNFDKLEGKIPLGISLEVQQCLKKIPIKFLEVLILHDLDGYSREEISNQLNIPAGTVASRLFKARKYYKNISSEENGKTE